MKSLILLAWLALAIPCAAAPASDVLPDKPEPQARIVADRDFWIDAGAVAAAWTADTVSTHALFAAAPTATEAGGLFDGSRSTPKVMAAWASVDVGMGFVAYEWKNHVRNRYLHPLWRGFLAAPITWHIQGTIHNEALISSVRKSR